MVVALAGCKEKEDDATSPTTGPSATTVPAPGGGGTCAKLISFSYDPTPASLSHKEFNPAFVKHWKEQTGQSIEVETVHGPSGQQAQSIISGNQADIAALSVDIDIDKIAASRPLANSDGCEDPHHSLPNMTCCRVVFLVRKGNPKGIKDGYRPRPQGRRSASPRTPRPAAACAVDRPVGVGPTCSARTATTRRPPARSLTKVYVDALREAFRPLVTGSSLRRSSADSPSTRPLTSLRS